MTRSQLCVAILAGSASAGAIAFAAPMPPTEQSRAETACRAQGVRPNSAAWELCLSHVTRAYEWGQPNLASQLARSTGDARDACLASGLVPGSISYRACVETEVDTRVQVLILGDDRTGENVAESP